MVKSFGSEKDRATAFWHLLENVVTIKRARGAIVKTCIRLFGSCFDREEVIIRTLMRCADRFGYIEGDAQPSSKWYFDSEIGSLLTFICETSKDVCKHVLAGDYGNEIPFSDLLINEDASIDSAIIKNGGQLAEDVVSELNYDRHLEIVLKRNFSGSNFTIEQIANIVDDSGGWRKASVEIGIPYYCFRMSMISIRMELERMGIKPQRSR
jgi:hypothetical protein